MALACAPFVMMNMAVKHLIEKYSIMEKVPSEVFYVVFALIGVLISRKFLRYQTTRVRFFFFFFIIHINFNVYIPSAVAYNLYCLLKYLLSFTLQREVKSKIARKLEKTQSNYRLLEKSLTSNGTQLLNPKRKEIIELPIKQLLVKLQNGQLSCVDVLKAYQAKVSFIPTIYIILKLYNLFLILGFGGNTRY